MMVVQYRMKAHKVSFSGLRVDVFPRVSLHKRLVDWTTKHSNCVSKIHQNLGSVVYLEVRALAFDGIWMNDGIHGGVVLAANRIRVAFNRILEECSGIIEGMTCCDRDTMRLVQYIEGFQHIIFVLRERYVSYLDHLDHPLSRYPQDNW